MTSKVLDTIAPPSGSRRLAQKLLLSCGRPRFNVGKALSEARATLRPSSADQFRFYKYAKMAWTQHIWHVSNVVAGNMSQLVTTLPLDVDPNSDSRRTVLLFAAIKGLGDIVAQLLDSGIDVRVGDETARTALSFAAENGHEAVVRLLVDRGVDPKSVDNVFLRTPLHWAQENGHAAIVSLLQKDSSYELEGHDFSGMILGAQPKGK